MVPAVAVCVLLRPLHTPASVSARALTSTLLRSPGPDQQYVRDQVKAQRVRAASAVRRATQFSREAVAKVRPWPARQPSRF